MDPPHMPVEMTVSPDATGLAAPRGRRLLVAWAMWGAVTALTLGLFVAGIPARFNELSNVCAGTDCAFLQRSPEEVRALLQLGLSLRLYALYVTTLEIVFALGHFLIGALIFWRKSEDRMAVLVSLTLVTFGVTPTFTLDALEAIHPAWRLPVEFVQAFGTGSGLISLYLFPDGRFVPRWTRPLAGIWVVWTLTWPLFPGMPFNPIHGDTWFRTPLLSFLVLLGWFNTGVFAQIYRYRRVSSLVQRQQTKWVVFGFAVSFLAGIVRFLPPLILPSLHQPGLPSLLNDLIGAPVAVFLGLFLPLSIGVSMLRYRLWDIDPIINRTLVYGALTGSLVLVYLSSVALFQQLFRALTDQRSNLAAVAATLLIAVLFHPWRRHLQAFIDRRFYREKVDFRQAFTAFSHQVRTIIALPELLRVLVTHTTDLLHIEHGAVFLRNADGAFQLAEARNLPPDVVEPLLLDHGVLDRLGAGVAISRPTDNTFPLLLPLTAPRAGWRGQETDHSRLVGVLAVGPRLSGQRFSREDYALLMGLADQAGTAIAVAQLVEEKQAEARRKEEAERRLEAHRNSPLGRAEAMARALSTQPETALNELYRLAQAAGQDPDAAGLLGNLPTALHNLDAGPLADLAEGFNYLFSSQSSPELLPVGLRTLIEALTPATSPKAGPHPPLPLPPQRWGGLRGGQAEERWGGLRGGQEEKPWQGAAEALAVYRLCQAALDVNSVAGITQWRPHLREGTRPARSEPSSQARAEGTGQDSRDPAPVTHLARFLAQLQPAASALYAYERVDAPEDKLAYLVRAVEQLSRVDRLARAELGSADWPVIQQIVVRWQAVVTGVMSELQTRAQIACRLITRHVWQDDVMSLVLGLRNAGRGTALNLQVALVPTPEYSLVDEMVALERLVPGEEVQVVVRVRPRRAAVGVHDHAPPLRARFIIRYTDSHGSDQVEHFADVVHLLTPAAAFQFIPNPYVVGTPLPVGSPLFFGREDLLAFIQENLAAAHRNNLVLIGQRRTGKTSLLKQLPLRLGADYLPVYLDGQVLGFDPGLPNFFLTLATEIGLALEDQGVPIELPELRDFAHRPAATFEYQFLARVREVIGGRHLLLLLDEFEELETAVRRGNLDVSVFSFLRHLIQHTDNLSVIFCGTHRMEELTADYWGVLFNISLYRHVGFLERPEALRLIQEPVAGYGMRYDDLSLDKMWQVTAGHPYFLQLLCHSLVHRHNRTQRNYITVADVNAALEEILTAGEAHFLYLWMESTPEEQLALTALSRMMPPTGYATPVQVGDYLAERGAHVERRAISAALHRLVLRDILKAGDEVDPALGEAYRWRLGLLGLWVERYKSLSHVVDSLITD